MGQATLASPSQQWPVGGSTGTLRDSERGVTRRSRWGTAEEWGPSGVHVSRGPITDIRVKRDKFSKCQSGLLEGHTVVTGSQASCTVVISTELTGRSQGSSMPPQVPECHGAMGVTALLGLTPARTLV